MKYFEGMRLFAKMGLRQLVISKFHNLRANSEMPSFFEFSFVGWATASIFFSFVPGKEIVAYWAMLGCFLTFLVWEWPHNKQLDRIVPTILIAILIPLGLHLLIGLAQVAHRFYEVTIVGVFENANVRGHISIGVKNLSIACTFCAVLGHQITKYYVRHRRFGLVIIALSVSMLGLLNSLIGIFSYFIFITFEIIGNCWRQKSVSNIGAATILKSIPNELVVGTFALLLTFPISGGLERVQQLPSSLMAIEQKETYQSWVEPTKFYSEFCSNECEVNASVYYRGAWAIFGLQTIVENPMGLGNVEEPLKAALRKKYPMVSDSSLPNDFHSELIGFGVRYGIVMLLVVLAISMWMYARLFLKSRDSDSAHLALGFLVIIFTRLALDSIGMGGVSVALLLLLLLSIISIKFEGFRGV